MATYDFSPFYRSTVGFDRVFNRLDQLVGQEAKSYPPYNIEKTGADAYRITIAVAGFKADEIEIVAQQNLLQVAGKKGETQDNNPVQMLHLGIANRGFERRFELADFVRVENAELRDGLLSIDLIREIPEAMKPRKIEINGASPQTIDVQPAAEPQKGHQTVEA